MVAVLFSEFFAISAARYPMEPVESNPMIIGVDAGESALSLDSRTVINLGRYFSCALFPLKRSFAVELLLMPLLLFSRFQSAAV